eukprot:2359269-Pyramimonas_sp.AAC.1
MRVAWGQAPRVQATNDHQDQEWQGQEASHLKQSGVIASPRQKQKIVFPRLSDVIDDAFYFLNAY